ncbi:O-antigen ligase family protein [Marinobacter shengliensis]|uniref:O-antigen ligase family protein n=1 Tax=Marinobacter shengliensis TaxID=1389223 RepID=UPI001E42F7B1|nr:O-antigen ligase family protein [Marinobacter shengliensis]MCD1631305.1 O-antigen ligase family protein [Marinobacter shengliensis]
MAGKGADAQCQAKASDQVVSSFTFVFFLYFTLDFFLRFSVRIPGYSSLRPTLVAVAILLLLLFVQREKLAEKFRHPVFKPVFALLAYIVISLPLVEWPGSVIRNNLDPFVKAIVFLFFTALIVDTRRRLVWFVGVFVFCQLVRVLEPLYLNLTQGYWGSSTYLSTAEFANRLSGAPADVINPNELGFVIVTVIPFLHYLLWTGRWKLKAVYLILMPLLLYALILTMSRGAFLALMVVSFFIFKESRHKAALAGVAVMVIVAAFSVMTPVQKERYLSIIDRDVEGGASAEGRIQGMIQEFQLGLTRPVVGHGLGTTGETKANKLGRRQASHNLYAELLIEIGVIGFVIFINFLVRTFRQLKRLQREFGRSDRVEISFYENLNKVLICLFWMYAVYSINYWGLSQYYWYLFGGLSIALGRLAMSEKSDSTPAEGTAIIEYKESGRFNLAEKLRDGRHHFG